ncbi:hypothetical protein ABZ297_25740 [Nonomuraea sp. NPDC005983]
MGHNAYQDDPQVMAAIAAFLNDRPLPLPRYDADTPPAGYQGPP